MDAKSTPGPWVVVEPKTNNYRYEIHGERGPRGAERVVARCPAPNGRATDAEHNAKLIAAAPALAAALEAFVGAPCGCTPRERDSGHLTDCPFPALRDAASLALRAAGRL